MVSQALWQGVLVGLILSIAVGPVMFALVQTSLREGFWRALIMEAGIVLSDATCIVAAFFSIGQLVSNPSVQDYILTGGGIMLIVFGVRSFTGKSRTIQNAKDFIRGKKTDPFRLFIKGFLYNLLNPSVLLFWIGAVSIASADYAGSASSIYTHFSATICTVFFFDVLKIFFADKIKRFVKPRIMIVINRVLGMIFIIFGCVLIVRAVFFT